MEVGRVSVRVVPDTRGFRQAVARAADQVERLEDVQLRIRVDTSGLGRELRDAVRDAERAAPEAEVGVGLDRTSQARVSGALAGLARPRFVEFIPTLDVSAFSRVAGSLAALAGAVSGVNMIRRVGSLLDGLGRHADLAAAGLAAVAAGGVAVGASLGAAASSVLALGPGLARIGAVALPLPGILMGAGVQAAALGKGLLTIVDKKGPLKDVAAQLEAFSKRMDEAFAAAFRGSHEVTAAWRRFGDVIVEQSTRMGELVGAMTGAMSAHTLPYWISLLEVASAASKRLADAAVPLARVMGMFAVIGEEYLPRLTEWTVRATQAFAYWLEAAVRSGKAFEWIDRGIESMRDLGSVAYSTGSILLGVGAAAERAGAGGLSGMARALRDMREVVWSPGFQDGLAGFFAGGRAGVAAFAAEMSGPARQAVLAFRDTVIRSAGVVGDALGTMLGGVLEGVSSAGTQASFARLFESLGRAADAARPGAVALGEALGHLADIAGPLLEVLAPIAAVIAGGLRDALAAVKGPLVQVAQVLGGVVLSALEAVGPWVRTVIPEGLRLVGEGLRAVEPAARAAGEQLRAAIAGFDFSAGLEQGRAQLGGLVRVLEGVRDVLVSMWNGIVKPYFEADWSYGQAAIVEFLHLVGELLTGLAPVVGTVLEGMMRGSEMLASALLPVVGVLRDFLGPAIEGIGAGFERFQPLMAEVSRVWREEMGPALESLRESMGPVSGELGKLVGQVAVLLAMGLAEGLKVVVPLISGLATAIEAAAWWQERMNFLLTGSIQALREFGAAGEGNWLKLLSPMAMVIEVGRRAADVFARVGAVLGGSLRAGVAAAADAVRGLGGQVAAAVGDLSGTLVRAGKQLIDGLLRGLAQQRDRVREWFAQLTRDIPTWKGPAALDRVLLTPAGVAIIDSLIVGMESRYGAVRESLRGLTSDIAGVGFVGPVVGAPGVGVVPVHGGAPGQVTVHYHGVGGAVGDGLVRAAERAAQELWR